MYNMMFVFVSLVFLVMALYMLARQCCNLRLIEEMGFFGLQKLFLKDWCVRFQIGYLALNFFYSLIISLSPMWRWNGLIWLISTIISIFVLLSLIRRLIRYSDSEFILKRFFKNCHIAFKKGNDNEIFYNVDIVVVVMSYAIEKNRIALAKNVMKFLITIIEDYVRVIASRPKFNGDDIGVTDKINIFLTYVSKSLFWAFNEALDKKSEPILQAILSIFGKISVLLAKYHSSLIVVPLSFLEKCFNNVINKKEEDIMVVTSQILSEVAKNIIEISYTKNESFKESLTMIFFYLDENIRKMVELWPSINPALLMQPFAEIGQKLGEERYKNIPDRAEIINELRRYLTEFNILDIAK